MFDDLANDSGFSVDSVEKSSQQSQQQNQSSGYQNQRQEGGGYNGGSYGNNNGGYQNRQNNYSGGGYQQRQGGNSGGYQQRQGGGFQRKPDEVSPPYLPVVMFVEKDMPSDVKQKFYQLASKNKLSAKSMSLSSFIYVAVEESDAFSSISFLR